MNGASALNKWIKGTNAAVLALALVGLFVFVTIIFSQFADLQIDMTTTKKFSLSEQSKTVVDQLTKPVVVRAFIATQAQNDPYVKQAISLLDVYKRENNQISIQVSDPEKDPEQARKYGVSQSGTFIFESGDQRQSVTLSDLFMAGADSDTFYFNGEEAYTRSIAVLNGQKTKKAYLVTGHGELTPAQAPIMFSKVGLAGYEVSELNLDREESVPADAQVIFLLGPTKDLSIDEVAKLWVYIQGSGKLIASIGSPEDGKPLVHYDALLKQMGIVNQNAIVFEPTRLVNENPYYLIPYLSTHPVTKPIVDAALQVMSYRTTAMTLEKPASNWAPAAILMSGEKAYAKPVNVIQEGLNKNNFQQRSTDISGQLAMAVAVCDQTNRARTVVFGSTSMLQDRVFLQFANRDLVMNSISWLDEMTSGITIRPHEERVQATLLLPNQKQWIFAGTVWIFPGVLLLIGAVIWWRRQRG